MPTYNRLVSIAKGIEQQRDRQRGYDDTHVEALREISLPWMKAEISYGRELKREELPDSYESRRASALQLQPASPPFTPGAAAHRTMAALLALANNSSDEATSRAALRSVFAFSNTHVPLPSPATPDARPHFAEHGLGSHVGAFTPGAGRLLGPGPSSVEAAQRQSLQARILQGVSPASSRERAGNPIPTYKDFLTKAKEVRTESGRKKEQFFAKYNASIAGRLPSLEQSFHVWANQLAYIHPKLGTSIALNVPADRKNDYADSYRFEQSVVKCQVVFHLLKPDAYASRYIVLFRGTSPDRQAHYDDRGRIRREPSSLMVDADPVAVGYLSFLGVASTIKRWVKEAATQGSNVTFIGHSLGGNLALRALLDNITTGDFHKEAFARLRGKALWQPDVYCYSPAGLDAWTKHLLKDHDGSSRKKNAIVSCWHENDIIPLTGVLPPMTGKEIYCDPTDDFPKIREKGYRAKEAHTLPFLALEVCWGLKVAVRDSERPKPRAVLEAARSTLRPAVVTVIAVLKGAQELCCPKEV